MGENAQRTAKSTLIAEYRDKALRVAPRRVRVRHSVRPELAATPLVASAQGIGTYIDQGTAVRWTEQEPTEGNSH